MHIPDGYVGPQTYLPAFAIMVAMWSVGLAKLKKTLRMRQVPLLALAAGFSFMVMMFNVPIPGGSSGHAVGAVLVAILLGPWAAMVAISLALCVQALLFGDGGITTLGLNCLNMAVIMPFVGWWVYRLIAGSAHAQASRRWFAAAVAGYTGLCVTAIVTGFELGLQPLLAHDASGHALYAPFGFNIAMPAMAIGHLLVFGIVEAIVTGTVVVYLQQTATEMIGAPSGDSVKKPMALIARIAVVLGILLVLVPLGLYLPAKMHSGPAWGEWNAREIQTEIARHNGGQGYIPEGIKRAEEKGWRALLPDYQLPGKGVTSIFHLSLNYMLSGAIGVMVLGFLIMLGKMLLSRKEKADDFTSVDAQSHHT